MMPAESPSTTVSAIDIVSAVDMEVVTASAEQMPRIWTVTGFLSTRGSVRLRNATVI